jgi:fructuronate reductase
VTFLCDAEQNQQSINDPLEAVFFELVRRYRDDLVSLISTLLQCNDIFPTALAKNKALLVRLVSLVDGLLAGAKVQNLMQSASQNKDK